MEKLFKKLEGTVITEIFEDLKTVVEVSELMTEEVQENDVVVGSIADNDIAKKLHTLYDAAIKKHVALEREIGLEDAKKVTLSRLERKMDILKAMFSDIILRDIGTAAFNDKGEFHIELRKGWEIVRPKESCDCPACQLRKTLLDACFEPPDNLPEELKPLLENVPGGLRIFGGSRIIVVNGEGLAELLSGSRGEKPN